MRNDFVEFATAVIFGFSCLSAVILGPVYILQYLFG
jgi:hypothetical protein